MSPTSPIAIREAMLGLPISHAWHGHGSTIFLEFGALTPGNCRRDGSVGNANGTMGLMLGCAWRIETQDAILCGSQSDISDQDQALQQLIGATVSDLKVLGRLPEIALEFSNHSTVISFTAVEGDPEWTIFDRRVQPERCLAVVAGQLTEGLAEQPWPP